MVEMAAKGTFLARLRSSLTKLLKMLRLLLFFAETEDEIAKLIFFVANKCLS